MNSPTPGRPRNAELTDEILELLEKTDRPAMSIGDITESVSASRATVQGRLYELIEQGKVATKPVGNAKGYFLTDSERLDKLLEFAHSNWEVTGEQEEVLVKILSDGGDLEVLADVLEDARKLAASLVLSLVAFSAALVFFVDGSLVYAGIAFLVLVVGVLASIMYLMAPFIRRGLDTETVIKAWKLRREQERRQSA